MDRKGLKGTVLVCAIAAVMLASFIPLQAGGGEARAASPPRVVLTFDDGYGCDHRILEFLYSEGIQASAFVIGAWAQHNTSLVQEMSALGWDVCNHTQNHPWLTKIPDQNIAAELNTCQAVISQVTGQYNPCFRPPGGFIDDRVTGVAASLGYFPVMWDLDSMDSHNTAIPVEDRVRHMVESARDGSIILFHFGGRNTYELLTGVVRGLQARGFCFVTLGELYGWKDLVRGGDSGPGLEEVSLNRYFAEGTTRPGFQEWLLVMNPGEEEVCLRAEFFSSQGKIEKTYTVPPGARLSLPVNEEVPWQDDLSILLRSSAPIAAERSLYFNRGHGFGGGTVSQGISTPSTRFIFPEGTVRPGFEEYLSLFNPSKLAEASVAVGFYGEEGEVKEVVLKVAPTARVTARVNDLVEEGDYSMLLRSTVPVVAERSEYFTFNGMVTGAHCAGGVTEPHGEWFFAEGTTRDFFHSYLTLFNPCGYSTWVKVRLLLSDGSLREETVELPSERRRTLYLNACLPPDIDYSIHLYSLLPISAERASYFQSNNVWGGCCSRGSPSPATRWIFAEGCTDAGFNEWLAIFNPHLEQEEVTVQYRTGGVEAITRTYLLPPEGRLTLDAAVEAGMHGEMTVEISSRRGVVAERSLYFSRPAW